MAKHGEGLGYEIVKAVNNGEIIEPITYKKVRTFCESNGLNYTQKHMRVILPNSTDNNHSPTYKKYFERVSEGEYIVKTAYRHMKYYWVNLNSEQYEWSFSELKVGTVRSYSNLNQDSSKRKNENCFNNIKTGDKVIVYETGAIKAITAVCEVVDKYEEGEELIVELKKKRDFQKYLTLDIMKEMKGLKECTIIEFHRGTLFELEKKYYEAITSALEQLNVSRSYYEELYEEVKESRKLDNADRKIYLENRDSYIPERVERTSNEFKRNPHVIAEILERAKGICEKCGKPAPFNRVSDGTPYLEVHHKIWLADGGEDTVDNTIAVCPNCHRQLHFG